MILFKWYRTAHNPNEVMPLCQKNNGVYILLQVLHLKTEQTVWMTSGSLATYSPIKSELTQDLMRQCVIQIFGTESLL